MYWGCGMKQVKNHCHKRFTVHNIYLFYLGDQVILENLVAPKDQDYLFHLEVLLILQLPEHLQVEKWFLKI